VRRRGRGEARQQGGRLRGEGERRELDAGKGAAERRVRGTGVARVSKRGFIERGCDEIRSISDGRL